MEWWDINISVELESEDVCDKLVCDILQLCCDGTGHGRKHRCRRQFAASHKPTVFDEEDTEEAGSVASAS